MNARPLARPPRILLAEPKQDLCTWLLGVLRRADFDVTECPRVGGLLRSYKSPDVGDSLSEFDLVICDVRMLDDVTTGVIHSLQRRQQYPPLVLIDERDADGPRPPSRLHIAATIDQPLAIRRYIAMIRELATR